MKNKELFDKTIAVLVKAYLNGDLKHQDCKACVVGNLCNGSSLWRYLFCTDAHSQEQYVQSAEGFIACLHGFPNVEALLNEAEKVCLSTGYSIEELKRIEYAFETAKGYIHRDDETEMFDEELEEWMFNGLMAVVEVLQKIHEVPSEEIESTKRLFVKETVDN